MRDPHSAEEWQAYRDGQILPPGCVIRMDLATGERLYIPPRTEPVQQAPSRLWRGVAWGLGITAFCAIWWFVLATAR